MATEYDFTPLMNFLTTVFHRFRQEHPKSGKPSPYAEVGMLIFFMAMFLKRIVAFQTMARYAAIQYRHFGFQTAPSRQTIRRRFYACLSILQRVIPVAADDALPLDERFATQGIGFIDKCLFWAKGGADRGRYFVLIPCPPSHKWPVSKLKQAKALCPIPQDTSASFSFETGD
ncbi:hypothetical protein U27_05925 [Candidatus Vecturithrix granuli]|uniref:Transposase n=1 Tax=Vecturithrix granuli TaxID=1499967 RepID=A0A081C2Z5_VECG1|nr:hypothetical protein U27_05925 [Candidatus Vecturithrix granuli]